MARLHGRQLCNSSVDWFRASQTDSSALFPLRGLVASSQYGPCAGPVRRRCGRHRPAVLTTHGFLMWNDGSSGWCSATDPKRPLRSGPDSSRPFPSRYSTAAVGPRTAAASAGTADFPPSALPAAGRFRAPPSPGQPLSPARPPTLNSWRRFSGQRASGPGWTWSSQPFSAVALFRTADFAAVLALAFLSAAHRLFVAAMIRARPSGLRRRFLLGGRRLRWRRCRCSLGLPGSRQRFRCAAAMRRRAAGSTMRLGASSPRPRPSFRSPAAR